MATAGQLRDLVDEERPLTREEGFALLMSMRGTWHEMYESLGGVDAVIRQLDEGEEDDL